MNIYLMSVFVFSSWNILTETRYTDLVKFWSFKAITGLIKSFELMIVRNVLYQ